MYSGHTICHCDSNPLIGGHHAGFHAGHHAGHHALPETMGQESGQKLYRWELFNRFVCLVSYISAL